MTRATSTPASAETAFVNAVGSPTAPRRSRFALRILAINFAATLAVMTAQGAFSRAVPATVLLRAFLIAGLFCNTIGTLIAITVPRVIPRLWRWRSPANWAGLIALLLVINAVGCAFSLTVLAVTGVIPWPELFPEWLLSLRFGAAFTLVFGIAGTLYESLRSELERTALALRTKERDEAEAQRLATGARLASLESRVNPHFLFNTLNSIASLIHEDPRAAERVTGQLASLMRSSLDTGSTPLVPLDQELRVVRDYLDIERVRFGDRLRYDVEVDARIMPTPVPRLSLQTLVENSVKYAVSTRRDGASIAIRASGDNGRVRLDVEDDGPGFPEAPLPDGHGLALLRDRLAMTFGDRATLTIDGSPGRTRVSIDLPAGSSAPTSREPESADPDANRR